MPRNSVGERIVKLDWMDNELSAISGISEKGEGKSSIVLLRVILKNDWLQAFKYFEELNSNNISDFFSKCVNEKDYIGEKIARYVCTETVGINTTNFTLICIERFWGYKQITDIEWDDLYNYLDLLEESVYRTIDITYIFKLLNLNIVERVEKLAVLFTEFCEIESNRTDFVRERVVYATIQRGDFKLAQKLVDKWYLFNGVHVPSGIVEKVEDCGDEEALEESTLFLYGICMNCTNNSNMFLLRLFDNMVRCEILDNDKYVNVLNKIIQNGMSIDSVLENGLYKVVSIVKNVSFKKLDLIDLRGMRNIQVMLHLFMRVNDYDSIIRLLTCENNSAITNKVIEGSLVSLLCSNRYDVLLLWEYYCRPKNRIRKCSESMLSKEYIAYLEDNDLFSILDKIN